MNIRLQSACALLADKRFDEPSVFTAAGLLDGARRLKGLPVVAAPPVCVLDPDTDLVRHLRDAGLAARDPGWPCFHSEFYRMPAAHAEVGCDLGFVAGAVGAPYATLMAEQLFAAGARLVISIASAGQLAAIDRRPPYTILVTRALRDEGTSMHYRPPTRFAALDPAIVCALDGAFDASAVPVVAGATWTTDAPFRETRSAIEARCMEGLLGVEMEAAALYALSESRAVPIVCFAVVTNQMGQSDSDFEKGASHGAADALAVIRTTVRRLIGDNTSASGATDETPANQTP